MSIILAKQKASGATGATDFPKKKKTVRTRKFQSIHLTCWNSRYTH